MAYVSTTWSLPNQNLTSVQTILNQVYDASESHMVICTIRSSQFNTNLSEFTMTIYIDTWQYGGQVIKRIKPAGVTSVWYQLEPIFIPANASLRIDFESDNGSDTTVDLYGTLFAVQQSDARYLDGDDQSLADLKDFADDGYDPSTDTVSVSDVYHADVFWTRDNPNARDEYMVQWYKSGVPVTSGITSPTIQVVDREAGGDIIAESALTQIGAIGAYKYDATTTERLTDGAVAVVTATIDTGSRTWRVPVGRDA